MTRRFSDAFKANIALEAITRVSTVAELASRLSHEVQDAEVGETTGTPIFSEENANFANGPGGTRTHTGAILSRPRYAKKPEKNAQFKKIRALLRALGEADPRLAVVVDKLTRCSPGQLDRLDAYLDGLLAVASEE